MPENPFGLVYISDRVSIFHKLNPMDKLIGWVCLVVITYFSIKSIVGLLVLTAIVIAAQIACHPTWKEMRNAERFLIPTLTAFWVIIVFSYAYQQSLFLGAGGLTTGAADIGTLGPILYSKSAIVYGGATFLRGMIICSGFFMIVWTTHPRDIVYTLVHSMKVPYRLAWAFYLSLIYSSLLAYDATMIGYAQKIRGATYNHLNPRMMIDRFMMPLVERGTKRAMVTSMALDGRAFGSFPTRTFRYRPPRPRFSTALKISMLIITVLIFVVSPPFILTLVNVNEVMTLWP